MWLLYLYWANTLNISWYKEEQQTSINYKRKCFIYIVETTGEKLVHLSVYPKWHRQHRKGYWWFHQGPLDPTLCSGGCFSARWWSSRFLPLLLWRGPGGALSISETIPGQCWQLSVPLCNQDEAKERNYRQHSMDKLLTYDHTPSSATTIPTEGSSQTNIKVQNFDTQSEYDVLSWCLEYNIHYLSSYNIKFVGEGQI